jgi:hypothetical protein
MKFVEGEDNDFMRFDEVGDAAWNGMIPSTPLSPSQKYVLLTLQSDGAGYVKVDRPRRYDMEPSVPYGIGIEDAEVYQASVIHQLHCLVHSLRSCRILHPLIPSTGHITACPCRICAERAFGELLR